MVVAGFGWSAGDVAPAAKLVIKVSKAFKAANGAATKYADHIGFVQSLNLNNLIASPPHWKRFEAFLQQFDRSLSESSTRGKLAKAPRTIQFTLKDLSGEIDRLRVAVSQPLQVVNTLLSIQVVQETKLVPQKLRTPTQCLQLLDAIRLAGVPMAVEKRLERMESTQSSNLADATAVLSKKAQSIVDAVASLKALAEQACSSQNGTDPRPHGPAGDNVADF
ncbi:hypothetical protein Tdes44962_MAKER01902 [Teratosphaeria destructans]|uniref:Uncharacterized protein n=1 Tax=Teratosphaeria destructans TaxID=418781 RepID=A0A9W7SWG9_9PEZI|nr:hypothetical protein Tdes44962_MAKER01902 [Teratosphaeria destructans]